MFFQLCCGSYILAICLQLGKDRPTRELRDVEAIG